MSEVGFTFEDPGWFVLLPLLGGLLWWLHHTGRSRGVRLQVPSSDAVLATPTWRGVMYASARLALALASVLAVVALARPQREYVERDETADGIDIYLVMDVSTSMLAQDFTPNRLEASKAVAQRFVAERPFDRIGVTAFATDAFTLTPLTLDKRVVGTMLGGLSTGRTRSSTAIGMGLASAVNGLRDSDAPSKVVILLTDGMNTSGFIEPRDAADIAEEFGIRVYTIGVGTNGTAPSPTTLANGRVVLRRARVQIDEQLLREIAQQTGGQYFRATDDASLAQIYAEIDRLEKMPVEVSVSQRYDDLYSHFLMAAALLALLGGAVRIWITPSLV